MREAHPGNLLNLAKMLEEFGSPEGAADVRQAASEITALRGEVEEARRVIVRLGDAFDGGVPHKRRMAALAEARDYIVKAFGSMAAARSFLQGEGG